MVVARDRLDRAVRALDPSRHGGSAPSQVAHLSRQPALGEAERHREGGGGDCLWCDRPGHREVAGQEREAAPREREPRVRVQATAEKLEVVGADDDDPGDDEDADPGVAGDGADDPDRGGSADGDGRKRSQAPVGDRRPQRPAVQLVECVGADPDGQEERCEHRAEAESERPGASPAPIAT